MENNKSAAKESGVPGNGWDFFVVAMRMDPQDKGSPLAGTGGEAHAHESSGSLLAPVRAERLKT